MIYDDDFVGVKKILSGEFLMEMRSFRHVNDPMTQLDVLIFSFSFASSFYENYFNCGISND